MATNKLRGNDLRKIGYPEGPAIGMALDSSMGEWVQWGIGEWVNG